MLIVLIIVSILAAACLGFAIWFRREWKKSEAELQERLTNVEEDKEAALWQLYLSEVSLLTSVSALYNERRRFVDLKEISDETLRSYQEFLKNLKQQTERRLIRRGVAVVMSFVPGIGLLDVLGDVGEISDSAGNASESIDEMPGEIEKLAEIPSKLPFNESTIDDDTPFDLIENAHTTFQKSFKNEFVEFDENVVGASASEEQMNVDASELRTFVDDTIQSTQDLEPIKSITDEERQKIIDRTLNRVRKFAEAAVNKGQPEANAADQ